MDELSAIIRADRIAVGLSLQGLAERLNDDRSIGHDRAVTTSWLHHLENGRAKPLTTAMKKGLARALKQPEEKYLAQHESLPNRAASFVKFFDEQLTRCETSTSTLVCDFQVDPERAEELGDLLLCVYHFLVATDGKVVAFERSRHIALPILLTAIRTWPDVDDLNSNAVVSKILAPHAAGGFVDCLLPTPSAETLDWVTRRVEVFERTADDQASGLLDTDPMMYISVVSPSPNQGVPEKWTYYYLNQREYGLLRGPMADRAYRRFLHYRDSGIFSRCDYAESFEFSYPKAGEHYHLRFGKAESRPVRKAWNQ